MNQNAVRFTQAHPASNCSPSSANQRLLAINCRRLTHSCHQPPKAASITKIYTSLLSDSPAAIPQFPTSLHGTTARRMALGCSSALCHCCPPGS